MRSRVIGTVLAGGLAGIGCGGPVAAPVKTIEEATPHQQTSYPPAGAWSTEYNLAARALMDGRFDESLTRALRCFEVVQFLTQEWGEALAELLTMLSRHYPPAAMAVLDMILSLEESALSDKMSPVGLEVYAELTHELGLRKQALALLRRVRERQPRRLSLEQLMVRTFFYDLVEDGQLAVVAEHADFILSSLLSVAREANLREVIDACALVYFAALKSGSADVADIRERILNVPDRAYAFATLFHRAKHAQASDEVVYLSRTAKARLTESEYNDYSSVRYQNRDE